MAKTVTVVLNFPGVRELMQSAEMQGVINNAAAQVAASAEKLSGGLEFDVKQGVGKTRAWASVSPGSVHAIRKDRKDNVLERAKRSVKV